MSEALAVELFMEDAAHENLLVPLVKRIALEEGVDVRSQVRTARGGHPRAISELEIYLQNRQLLGLSSIAATWSTIGQLRARKKSR